MRAVTLHGVKDWEKLKLDHRPVPEPGPGQVRVRLKAAALNHRDVWIVQGLYPGIKVPVVLGSDGAGIVEAVGQGVSSDWLGREVIINPALDWGDNPRVQQKTFRILGLPDDGTHAEAVVVPAGNLFPKPAYLSWEEAAAIPLGGLTGYRALFTQGRVRAGETVLITGIGGGVAALMLQMALAAGARVLVTSGSEEKLARARAQGAAGGVNYRQPDWPEQLRALAGEQGIDLVVDSAGGEGFSHLVDLVNPGGRLVFFGATAGNPPGINQRKLFWKQLTLQGTTMGSPQDFREMVRLFQVHQIKPLVDSVHPLEAYRAAYLRMKEGQQFGKIVLKMD
ncbi:MAG: alcohol dehydrogenase [Calditrichaeota bacterium]|nr:MAG: alcohol dehydrogenase [Calditrichota bacterium]